MPTRVPLDPVATTPTSEKLNGKLSNAKQSASYIKPLLNGKKNQEMTDDHGNGISHITENISPRLHPPTPATDVTSKSTSSAEQHNRSSDKIQKALSSSSKDSFRKIPRKSQSSSRTLRARIIQSLNGNDVPNDTVLLSEDLFSDLVSPSYVAVQSLTSVYQGIPWTLFKCQLDSSLKPSTCTVGLGTQIGLGGGSNPQSGRWIQLTKVNPVIISHAIVSVNPEFYHSSDRKTQEKLLLTKLAETPIIRQGEFRPIEAGNYFRIRICEPVDQGLFIESEIKLTVVCEVASEDAVSISAFDGQDFDNADNNDEDSLDVEISKFLDFGSADSDVDDDAVYPNNAVTTSPNNGKQTSSIELSVSVIQKPFFIDTLIPTPGHFDDMEIAGFVRIEQLARLGCLSGDIVSISPRYPSLLGK